MSTIIICSGLHLSGAYAGDISSGRWAIHSEKPAGRWEDAFVTGNGRIGTMVMGMPGKETIVCVQEELFTRGWDRSVKSVAEVADKLPAIRKALAEGNPKPAVLDATKEARRQLTELGASQSWTVLPHPAFDLLMDIQTRGAVTNYHRSLDLECGVTEVRWQDELGGVQQGVFSSRADNINVIRLRSTDERPLNVTLELKERPGRGGNHFGHDFDNLFKTVTSEASEGGLYYFADYTLDRGGYEGLVRIEATGGTVRYEGTQAHVEGASELLLLMRIDFLDDAAVSHREKMGMELKRLPADFETLLAKHAALHGELFRRVKLDLGTEAQWKEVATDQLLEHSTENGISPLFLEQFFAMGRYLLISTCGRNPPPLQGMWGASWTPPWAGGFTIDSNVNLAMSAASMGNLPECAEAYFSFIERQLPGWRANAQSYLGTRGFLAAMNPDPETGYLTHILNNYPWIYWPGGAGWAIRPFYDHALLTGDDEFMEKRTYPLYRELSLFYEDYMVLGEDGYYHIGPGISPENFQNGCLVTHDTTFDVAVAKEVFTILIELGTQFGAEEKEIQKWESVRAKLLPYRINGDGAFAEWVPTCYPDNYNHRHNSHLYPVFPGMELLQPGADPALLKAVQVAMDKRFMFDTDSAHGLIHLALMATRLNDVEKVRINLDRFARRKYFFPSMMTSHNPNHSIYNLDSVLSIQRLLMEMVVFSRPGHIELMPAWPREYPDGSLEGVLVRGGHKIDISWAGGKLKSATLHAGSSGPCTVQYGSLTRTIELEAGKTFTFGAQLD